MARCLHCQSGQSLSRTIDGQCIDILRMVAEGKTNHKIAETFGLSAWTIKRRIRKMRDLLWAVDRTSLIVCAHQARLIDVDTIDVKRS